MDNLKKIQERNKKIDGDIAFFHLQVAVKVQANGLSLKYRLVHKRPLHRNQWSDSLHLGAKQISQVYTLHHLKHKGKS